jgi:hypothetical protein
MPAPTHRRAPHRRAPQAPDRTETVRRAVIAILAPAEPPCFPSRLVWLGHLAEMPATDGPSSPLVPADSSLGLRFNAALNFCVGCAQAHRRSMQAAGKCRPAYLRSVTTTEPEEV